MPLIAMVKSPADMQLEFMQAGNSGEGKTLQERLKLARELIQEEVIAELMPALDVLERQMETAEDVTALNGSLGTADAEELLAAYDEVADAIVDSVYVLLQLCNTLGLPFDALFYEVHRSNMSKFVAGEDGKPIAIKAGNGKILKGPNYSKPNLKPIIIKAIFHPVAKPQPEHCDHTQLH